MKKKRILVLEDDVFRARFFIERYGKHNLKIIEDAKIAINYLRDNIFDYIFLDNDLGHGNGSGIDVATFLHDNPNNINNNAIIIIHSWNRAASEKIKSKLLYSKIIPFTPEKFCDLGLDI